MHRPLIHPIQLPADKIAVTPINGDKHLHIRGKMMDDWGHITRGNRRAGI